MIVSECTATYTETCTTTTNCGSLSDQAQFSGELFCFISYYMFTIPRLKIGVTLAVSTVVTAVLVSLISVLLSSSVVYLLMKRTKSTSGRNFQENKGPNNTPVIYDLPNILKVDDVYEKEIKHNAAYGVL